MKKYIDADVALDTIDRIVELYPSELEKIKQAFLDMPAADVEPVRKWIPCSERLPEEGEEVLFLFISGNQQVGAREQNSWWSSFTERNAIEESDVVAWMPLPRVYNK